ncbi:hypothetical protein ALC62_05104, partial [Cyphomyrmex costatus]
RKREKVAERKRVRPRGGTIENQGAKETKGWPENACGVSSGPTWLPLAASLALGLFSPFLSFLPSESFILKYLGRFEVTTLVQQFRT